MSKLTDIFQVITILVFLLAMITVSFGWIVLNIVDYSISAEDGKLLSKENSTLCYDRFGSVIEDLTCTETIHCSKWGMWVPEKCDATWKVRR